MLRLVLRRKRPVARWCLLKGQKKPYWLFLSHGYYGDGQGVGRRHSNTLVDASAANQANRRDELRVWRYYEKAKAAGLKPGATKPLCDFERIEYANSEPGKRRRYTGLCETFARGVA